MRLLTRLEGRKPTHLTSAGDKEINITDFLWRRFKTNLSRLTGRCISITVKKILVYCQQNDYLYQKQHKITFGIKYCFVCSVTLIGRKQQSLLPRKLCHGDRDRVGMVLPVKMIRLSKTKLL